MSDMAACWLIWSNEHNSWWAPNCAGYTLYIDRAGRYSFQDARARCLDQSGRPFVGIGPTPPDEVMVPAPECNARDLLLALNAKVNEGSEEMELMDEFAARAMQGIVSSIDSEENYQRLRNHAKAQGMTVSQWIAQDAYKQAAAMMERRALVLHKARHSSCAD